MKKFYAFISFFALSHGFSQTQLFFKYDEAGNQIVRTIYFETSNKTEKKSIVENFKKFDKADTFSYFPNPVTDDLFLKWDALENKVVRNIIIYSLNGAVLKTFKELETQNEKNISFQDLPQGIYSLLLIYTSGKQDSIKIIKK